MACLQHVPNFPNLARRGIIRAMPARPPDSKRDALIKSLREAGLPVADIATRTGLSKSHVRRCLVAAMRRPVQRSEKPRC
jgi:DNA invertase Pin-like site-specific DNA recombinase